MNAGWPTARLATLSLATRDAVAARSRVGSGAVRGAGWLPLALRWRRRRRASGARVPWRLDDRDACAAGSRSSTCTSAERHDSTRVARVASATRRSRARPCDARRRASTASGDVTSARATGVRRRCASRRLHRAAHALATSRSGDAHAAFDDEPRRVRRRRWRLVSGGGARCRQSSARQFVRIDAASRDTRLVERSRPCDRAKRRHAAIDAREQRTCVTARAAREAVTRIATAALIAIAPSPPMRWREPQAWRDRRATSRMLSPRRCGEAATAYRRVLQISSGARRRRPLLSSPIGRAPPRRMSARPAPRRSPVDAARRRSRRRSGRPSVGGERRPASARSADRRRDSPDRAAHAHRARTAGL